VTQNWRFFTGRWCTML